MDSYSKLDHETLVRNMKAVCVGLAIAIEEGGRRHGGEPPALCYQDIEDLIPVTLHRIAIAAGWIEQQTPLDWLAVDHGVADLLGGDLIVEKPYKEWFLGLLAETLTDLEVKAENNLEAQSKYGQMLGERHMAWLQVKSDELRAAEAKPSAKDKIDEYCQKVKPWLQAIAKSATEKSKAAGDNIVVTRVSVSRIYNDEGKVGTAVRQAVGDLINEKVPCTAEDLLPSKTPQSRRSTPRNPSDSAPK